MQCEMLAFEISLLTLRLEYIAEQKKKTLKPLKLLDFRVVCTEFGFVLIFRH